MIVVGDSSVLIALARIGRLELLQQLYVRVTVPDAVWREVFGRSQTTIPPWIDHRGVTPSWLARVTAHLDAGELEAIALACELRADVLLMDERRGRVAALNLGLTVTGLGGVLLAAKKQGLIPAVAPIIRDLRSTQFWMSDQLVRLALELSGEQ